MRVERTATAKALGARLVHSRMCEEANKAGREATVAQLRSNRSIVNPDQQLQSAHHAHALFCMAGGWEVTAAFQGRFHPYHAAEKEGGGGWENFPGWPSWPRAEPGQEPSSVPLTTRPG